MNIPEMLYNDTERSPTVLNAVKMLVSELCVSDSQSTNL
jgi:hypothetical protein